MGVESEFDTIYDLLDSRQRGYIEYEDISDFYQAFYFMSVARDQVEEAVKHVCGNHAEGKCQKKQFLDLVVELERRRQIEEGSWWDFKALDTRDADRISIKEALFLMKSTHQEHFTSITWDSFLATRSHPHEDVNYAEIRMWLCNWPLQGSGCGYEEIIILGDKLDKEKKKQDMQRRKKVMNLEDDFIKAIEMQEKHQYSSKFRNESRRKLNRWVQLGVESLLFDDGYDAFEGDGTQRNTVNVQDLMEAMEEKYDILREKLLWESTQKHVGEAIWSSMREIEREEQVLRVKSKEKEHRLNGDFDKITQLSVSYQLYDNTLIFMMGYDRLAHLKYLKALQDKNKKMTEARKSEDEIFCTFAEEHSQATQGRATAGQLLIDLHKRHESEREFVLSILKGSQGRALFKAEMVTEYIHYVTQQMIASWEPAQLEYSAMAMGISERTQDLKTACFDYDRDLQEMLALERLHRDTPGGSRPDKPSGEHFPMEGRNRGIVDLQVEVMRALLRKHMHERKVMSYMVQGKESKAWRAASSRRATREERDQRLSELRSQCSQWRQESTEYMKAKQNAHIKMLLEGTWLYHANKQEDVRGGHNLSVTQVSAHVLADLQQHHSKELERVLLEMQHKDGKSLMGIWRREYNALNSEWLDGISAVILGTFELTLEELEIVSALEGKYDVLRDKLLMDALMKQYGEAEWRKMSEGERQRRLLELKREERRLRQAGKFDQAAKLLGESVKDKENLEKLMGKNREEFQKRLQQRLLEREKRKAMGLDSDTESDSETQEEESTTGNILRDLQKRHDEELNAIMLLLRQQQNQYLSEKERQELLLRLRREKRRAAKESNFDEAAILLGLAERNKANMEEKLRAERERQLLLARQRLAARKKKSGQPIDDDDPSLPPKGDLEAWRDAVLREMDRKHQAEQELLITIVMDEGSEDVRDAARKMGKEGRQQRLLYLRSRTETLNLDKKEDKEENRDILEEAGAIKSILRSRTMQELLTEVSQDEVTATLLADLQEEQGRESEVIMATIFTMNEEQLSRLRMDQIWARHNEKGFNVIIVFTQYEGVGDEDSLLKALDKKYETLREKLLKASLIQKVGGEKWEAITEEERHKMLLELKQQERRLKNDGKSGEEMSQQLGTTMISENLKRLMGLERTEYEEKRRHKLELRKRKSSDSNEDGEEEGISEDESEDDITDVLTQIEERQAAERDALIAQLRGVEAQYLNERERQAELARLKREVRKARMEEGFHAAALVLGLAERRQTAAYERLKQDRSRQEHLAKERLDVARNKKKLGTVQEEEEELQVLHNADKAAMQDGVLKMMDKKHERERTYLLLLLSHDFSEEERFIAMNMSSEARADRLQQIYNQRVQLGGGKQEECHKLLLEAAVLKLISRSRLLASTRRSEVTTDEVVVSIMADLQMQQDKESEKVIQGLPDRDLASLKKLQEENLGAMNDEKNDNVAIVITTTDLSSEAGENQLVEALEAKYDALKDKLLAEALMKQMGEGEWARLSERERQLRLMKLKLEERRLRQEGKVDEAAALLGDALKSQSALEALMGESKKAQEEKLRQRLALRKKRLEEGMTEEQVTQLEEEEVAEEEEEMKKRRKNVLLDLDMRLDAEKAALLAALRGQNEQLQSERERQAELARLRREQRRARQEDKFEAAALVMGMAQQAEDAKERDRQRQMQLAKERLAQRRRQKAAKAEGDKEDTMTAVMLPDDDGDKQALQEAVIKEMELKHVAERDFLMQLVQDESQGDLRKNASLMSEEKRQQRLGELKEQRRQWRESGPTEETQDEHTEILRKGVAVVLESRLLALQSSQEGEVTDTDVEVSLLADLQDKQDQESGYLMDDLETKSVMTLKQLKQVQFIARANRWNDNVAGTILVTKADSEKVTEEELLKALESKYDVMRDKLLAEALLKQTGEAEWAMLSERERQARLMKLKLQERKLRQENKFDEASALLSQGIKDQTELARLLGATKSEQEEKLRQRLEQRKRLKEERAAQGLNVDDETIDEIIRHDAARKEVLEERKKRHNILEDLNSHFEDEKNALMAALHNQDESLEGEKERQLALAKLRRDQRKLQDEERFEAAAALFGLAQQHEKAREVSYEKDKERQKQLARERLAARKSKMAAKKGGQSSELTRAEIQEQLMEEEKENAKADATQANKSADGIYTDHSQGSVSIVSSVMDEVDKKQASERGVLLTLVDSAMGNSKERQRLQELELEALLSQLEALKEERRQLREDADLEFGDVDTSKLNQEELTRHLSQVSEYQEQQHRLLKSAITIKIEMLRRMLIQEGRLTLEEIEEELSVLMLSELQQKQTVESTAVLSVIETFPGGGGSGVDDAERRKSISSLGGIASGVGHSFKRFFRSQFMEETKSEEVLLQIKSTQRRARREGWLDSVAVTVFDHSTVTFEMTTEMEEMTRRIQKKETTLMALDQELDEKKTQISKNSNGRSSEELDAMIDKLEKEYALKKKALEDQLEREKKQEVEMNEMNQELSQKEQELESLDKEMEEAIKKERERRPSEAFDADAMVAEIEKQYADKKRAMQAQLDRQRRLAMEKIAARKQRQEDRDFEDQMAMALIHAAEKNKTHKEEAAEEQKAKQNLLMQERLAARREQRRKAAEERAEAERQAQEDKRKREATTEKEEKKKVKFGLETSENHPKPKKARKGVRFSEPPPESPTGGGLLREKTVVDINMSEDEKHNVTKMLLSDHSNVQWKIEKERQKRSKELQERLEMRKTRIQDAATTILGLGERQKTMVENAKKDERERQGARVRERIQRVKYERTQTTIKPKLVEKKRFDEYTSQEESGLSEDEKMTRLADKINNQFKKDELNYKSGAKSAFTPDEEDLESTSSESKPSTPQVSARPKTGRLLGQKERERLIKDRQAKRREIKKVANNSISAAPDMDSLAKMIEDRKKAAMDSAEPEVEVENEDDV